MTVPVRKPRAEINTGDMPVGQKAPIIMPALADGMPDREELAIAPAIEGPSGKLNKLMGDIAFGEEPVTICLSQSNEKHAPKFIPCWNNGKKAEVLINGQWIAQGWLPVGVPITTKRKYAEVLARSKQDSVTTDVVRHPEYEQNLVNFSTSLTSPFSIINATSKDMDWMNKISREM
jgi:hypothetical protein